MFNPTNLFKLIITSLMILIVGIACEQQTETPDMVANTSAENTSAEKPAFSAFDNPPKPVGDYKALMNNLKYPEAARKAGVEGKVLVKALIKADGTVGKAEIVRSLGTSGCDEAAVAAVQKTVWEPATKEGKPVDAEVTIPFHFKLN